MYVLLTCTSSHVMFFAFVLENTDVNPFLHSPEGT